MKFFKILGFKFAIFVGFMRIPFVFKKTSLIKEKVVVSRVMTEKNINTVEDVARYLSTLKYKRDKFNSQFFAHETIKNNGGDCEDIHRVGQIMLEILDKSVYLVYALTKKFGHAFIVFEDDGQIKGMDYSRIIEGDDIEDVITDVMSRYGDRNVLYYELRDMEFNKIS